MLFGRFVAAVILGFALSAILLLPFTEFLHIGHDVHQPSNVGGEKAGTAADGSIVARDFLSASSDIRTDQQFNLFELLWMDRE